MTVKNPSTTKVSLQVPAKVNPQVRVGPLRKDGYHDVTLVYQAISLYDILTVSSSSQGPSISIAGIDSHRIPIDGQNLVIKAAILLGNHVKIEPRVHFELVKSIPIEAGLGGGSADAAAALVGCNLLWKADLSTDDLMALGAHIGEDVPFFIKGMMALGMGHKQPLISLKTSKFTWHWVLGVPFGGLSTRAVFGKHDDILSGSLETEREYLRNRTNCIQTPWGIKDPIELLPDLINDLEIPSAQLHPDITSALRVGQSAGAISSLMSGSGSTCAFLAKDEAHARSLMTKLQEEKVFRAVIQVSGPVEGVKIIKS
ncbi:Ribosomal protein S5 domain 2-type fold subgroup [Penicillium taxi]|uniref:Ribosomal protein S5 domain 2-type fold subgroup n=1 Tax=Penicillium taxi TaxID=168475 RepID=UPI00254579BC|nr:Ribosomal protein S5 domain 2-type fold subgroup [Penicillium taxi]KAJ5894667.1 Ribosomal protein S5 domain 2-type fold subgroup [Penicillium taxi]